MRLKLLEQLSKVLLNVSASSLVTLNSMLLVLALVDLIVAGILASEAVRMLVRTVLLI